MCIRDRSQPVAGFAAAIMTGDRSGLAPSLVKDLRRTNLAHLLAISGLHMGLLVSVMLLAVRTICLLLPVFITRLYAKKIAAFVALCTAAVYLGLSWAIWGEHIDTACLCNGGRYVGRSFV